MANPREVLAKLKACIDSDDVRFDWACSKLPDCKESLTVTVSRLVDGKWVVDKTFIRERTPILNLLDTYLDLLGCHLWSEDCEWVFRESGLGEALL